MTTVKLRPEIKEKWVAALRSGDYQQGKSSLHYVGPVDGVSKFCCLGVLCDLAVKDGLGVKVEGRPGMSTLYGGAAGLPPTVVEKWAFGEHPDYDAGYLWNVRTADGVERSLPEVNDGADYSFAEIADAIEESL